MASEEHLEILRKGVEVWNRWRKENPGVIPELDGADLEGEKLKGVNLGQANLLKANLGGADLREAQLEGANLSGANLTRVDLSDARLVRTQLTFARLIEARLRGTNLKRATLQAATLHKANFNAACLSSACLRAANFDEADLRHAQLNMADLTKAQLLGADFSGADLDGADVSESIMGGTLLGALDLSNVKGFDSVLHLAPSSIGIDTIYRSKGKIPEVFLRGAGVPETFITYAKSLVVNPIEYYSCFISYSSKDDEFAKKLHRDLQGEQVRCWFAPHDVQGGQKLHEQIDRAIHLQDRVLLVLSPHSMNSEWVKTEIAKARKRELQEKRHVLFPILLTSFEAIRDWECFDADAGKDSAREIREYFIPDFSNWRDHDSYQEAFGRLLRDLKAGEKMPA